MGVYQRIAASQRFKLIGGRHKRQAGKARQLCCRSFCVTLGGIQAGAYSGAAQRQLTQMRQCIAYMFRAMVELGHVT